MLKNLFISMRPKQWIKNLFIFSALLFVREFTKLDKILLALEAFVLFCLASSAVYLFNDLLDLPKDREHPLKKHRPLASGNISKQAVGSAAFLLLLISIAAGFYLNIPFGYALLAYLILNLLYSLKLKEIIILDVFSIAIGFVFRVVAGAVVIDVPFSVWLILCTFFLTLFLAINKRKNEYAFDSTSGARRVLSEYSIPFLDQISIVSLSATIISYTFYTFSSEHSKLLMVTVPIVLYGLFYYLFVMSQKREGDNGPSDVFLRERNLRLTVLIWILVVGLILLFKS